MGRLLGPLIFLSLLAACTGPDAVRPPLQVAEEHAHFANCASYIQASMPGSAADTARAGALERCLKRNSGGRQVATRL